MPSSVSGWIDRRHPVENAVHADALSLSLSLSASSQSLVSKCHQSQAESLSRSPLQLQDPPPAGERKMRISAFSCLESEGKIFQCILYRGLMP